MTRTASDRLWAALRAAGAECVFGLPGSQTIDAFQALKGSGLRTVVPTHEMAAAFMANGYARASGKPGILTTIPGPGFTYALTGLAEAWLDSAPLLHVVPAAREVPSREYALQAIDQRAMAAPIVKRILKPSGPHELAAAAAEGYRLASEGEPGPVLLEAPEEVFSMEATHVQEVPLPREPSEVPDSLVDEIATQIDAVPRLLLYLGAGVLDHSAAVRALVDATGAAVVTTTTARGVMREDDERVIVRDPGMQAAFVLNALAERADLIVALGCKFSHNGAAGFQVRLPREKLVTVNAAGPSKNYPARLHATADAGRMLQALVSRLTPGQRSAVGWDADQLAKWRREALDYTRVGRIEPRLERSATPVSDLLRQMRDTLPDDAIVVTDSGLHQMCVRRYYAVRSPRGLIVPTNFQSMGYALPAAIGAAIAAPHRRVVAVIGDGGMMMSGLELLTAVREKIRLTVIVFNDAAYALIRNAQLSGHGASHGTELMTPDFEALAAATGTAYRSVGRDGIVPALADGRRGEPAVRLVEVPLEDSPGLRRMRLKGKVRATARRLLSRRHRGLLSRWLRR
jgi:acetolactate synthase-1/2/3 large subunit